MTNAEPVLLVDGKQAFPEIIRCINEAKETIEINMFIWRADAIGIRLAEEILAAANRGVNIKISVDRYGMILERSEESTYSFFHEKPSITEWTKILALRLCYPGHCKPKRPSMHRNLLSKILNHPRIDVQRDICKADHSKYYIFDESTIIFGGINVEDKENGSDLQGRIYQDYMVKLVGAEYVRAFKDKLNRNEDTSFPYRFSMNNKTCLPHKFDMLAEYLKIIHGAESELVIVMAYFSSVAPIVDALLAADRRGVKITIMIPEHANFQDQSNRKAMANLMRLSSDRISVYLSPKMVHTKLMYSEKTVTMGSCNMTPRSFRQLGELNFTFPQDDSVFVKSLKESVDKNMLLSQKANHSRDISYHRLFAWIEEKTV